MENLTAQEDLERERERSARLADENAALRATADLNWPDTYRGATWEQLLDCTGPLGAFMRDAVHPAAIKRFTIVQDAEAKLLAELRRNEFLMADAETYRQAEQDLRAEMTAVRSVLETAGETETNVQAAERVRRERDEARLEIARLRAAAAEVGPGEGPVAHRDFKPDNVCEECDGSGHVTLRDEGGDHYTDVCDACGGAGEPPTEAAPKGGTPEPARCCVCEESFAPGDAVRVDNDGSLLHDVDCEHPRLSTDGLAALREQHEAMARVVQRRPAAPEPPAAPLPEPVQAGQRLVRYESLDQPPPTGLYVMDYGETGGNPRYEVRFAFEGETCFDAEGDARGALAEYETALRSTLAPAAAAPQGAGPDDATPMILPVPMHPSDLPGRHTEASLRAAIEIGAAAGLPPSLLRDERAAPSAPLGAGPTVEQRHELTVAAMTYARAFDEVSAGPSEETARDALAAFRRLEGAARKYAAPAPEPPAAPLPEPARLSDVRCAVCRERFGPGDAVRVDTDGSPVHDLDCEHPKVRMADGEAPSASGREWWRCACGTYHIDVDLCPRCDCERPPCTPAAAAPQGAGPETPDERERAIVRRLAGEWGEQEVGPIETLDDCVKAIHGAGTMFMRMVTEVGDWSYWARKHLGTKEHRDAKLREALDARLAAPSAPLGGPPEGWTVANDDQGRVVLVGKGPNGTPWKVFVSMGYVVGRARNVNTGEWLDAAPPALPTRWLLNYDPAASPPHGEPAGPHVAVTPAGKHCRSCSSPLYGPDDMPRDIAILRRWDKALGGDDDGPLSSVSSLERRTLALAQPPHGERPVSEVANASETAARSRIAENATSAASTYVPEVGDRVVVEAVVDMDEEGLYVGHPGTIEDVNGDGTLLLHMPDGGYTLATRVRPTRCTAAHHLGPIVDGECKDCLNGERYPVRPTSDEPGKVKP